MEQKDVRGCADEDDCDWIFHSCVFNCYCFFWLIVCFFNPLTLTLRRDKLSKGRSLDAFRYQESSLIGHPHHSRSVFCSELGHDVLAMRVHRLIADEELRGYLFGSMLVGDEV